MVSNAALRSSNTNREIQPRSDDKSKSFETVMRAVSVLWYCLNPDWKPSQIPFLSKKEHSCDDTASLVSRQVTREESGANEPIIR